MTPEEIQALENDLIVADEAGDTETLNAILDILEDIDQTMEKPPAPPSDKGFFGELASGAVDVYEGAKEAFTGEERSTPEIEALPDISDMPVTEGFSEILKGLGLGASTLFADKEETRKILESNIEGLTVREDEKGNYIYKNPIDGKEYAYKPGFRASDIPKTIASVLAFTPAGRGASLAGRAGLAGATQTAIEGGQAAMGGEFNPEQVPLAGAMQFGGDIAGRAITAVAPKSALAGKVIDDSTPDLPMSDLVSKASGSDGLFTGGAKRIVQEQVKPDQNIVEAAKRLGIEEFLQPDHVSTNQAFKELSAGVRSFPGMQSRQLEREGLEKVAERADNLIEEIGGMQDLSQMNNNIRDALTETQESLLQKSDKLYSEVNKSIPPKTPAAANNLLSFLNKKADELGGVEFLSGQEKSLLNSMTPTKAKDGKEIFPTYARLDGVRKSLTSARVKKEGIFKDAESGILKKLEQELLKDQKIIAENAGVGKVFEEARKTVAIRKGVEDDLTALFGKNLEKSIVSKLSTGVKKLSTGDVTGLSKILRSAPEAKRQEIVASGLNAAFGKTAKRGDLNFSSYAKWYEGLNKNKQAKSLIFSNLPKEAQKSLDDLYKVSKGISTSSKEVITTGRIGSVRDEFANADSLIGKIYSVGRNIGQAAAAEGAASAVGIPGAGLVGYMAASLKGGKTDAIKAADKLLTSPVFIENAKKGTPEAAQKIANSAPFKQFLNKLSQNQRISDPVQFITNAFQASKNQSE